MAGPMSAYCAINLHRGPGTCVFQQGLDITQYESGIHGDGNARQGLLVIPYPWLVGQEPSLNGLRILRGEQSRR